MSALKICPQCGAEYELDQRFCPKDGSTLRTQNPEGDLVGAIIADRYHILKKLGEGGMGAVYLAEHVKMGRKSAVKVMNPGMASDADAIARFNREAANASRINHPNVCAVYDFGETSDGVIYLAMEFIEGPSLTSVIHQAGALPAKRAAEITRQASEALAVAHDMGIVHRDLKPDNIMIAAGRDGTDIVKVVDFGIAKAANSEAQKVTKTGLVVGTPEYMSPEQLAGDKLDGRSDLYSLALVAFNMLTGKLPFPANTVQESMIMRLTDTPRPLSEMKPDVTWTPEVQAVMDRALARDLNERYQSASEFGRELAKAVEAMDVGGGATSVMSPPVSAPAIPKTSVTPKGSSTVPPTRVGAAPVAPAPTPTKSRTPMIAGIAALVVVVGGGGLWMAMKGAGGDNAPATPQGTAQLNQPVSAPPAAAPRDFDAELDDIAKLTDLQVGTPATAATALQKLDSFPNSGLTADQRVLAALLRAEANVLRESNGAACRAVQDVEGASRGTKYENRVAFIIKNAC